MLATFLQATSSTRRKDLLMAAPFDAERLELIGPAVPVIEGVMMARPGAPALGHFAVSASGSLAYLAGPVRNSQQTLHWVDRRGREESLNVEPRSYLFPKVSPDGTRLAVEVVQSGNRDIWIYDLVRKTWQPAHVRSRRRWATRMDARRAASRLQVKSRSRGVQLVLAASRWRWPS